MPFPFARRAALALCLAAPASAALAADSTWAFVYEGFVHTYTNWQGTTAPVFKPHEKLRGSFSGTDANGNGTLEHSELSSFVVLGTDYLNCPLPYASCGLSSFSFGANGDLQFNTSYGSQDPDGYFYRYFTADVGSTWEEGLSSTVASPYDNVYAWTPQTTLLVTSVPEPAAWQLLGAGGLLLGVVGVRRRRRRVAFEPLPQPVAVTH